MENLNLETLLSHVVKSNRLSEIQTFYFPQTYRKVRLRDLVVPLVLILHTSMRK